MAGFSSTTPARVPTELAGLVQRAALAPTAGTASVATIAAQNAPSKARAPPVWVVTARATTAPDGLVRHAAFALADGMAWHATSHAANVLCVGHVSLV
jgi:hypothetical protein